MTVEASVRRGTVTARRTLTAVVAIPPFLGALYLGGPFWTGLLLTATLGGAWEWRALGRAAGLSPASAVILAGAVLIYSAAVYRPAALAGAAAALVLAALLAQLSPAARPQALANAGVTVLGPLYVSLFAALDLLRRLPADGLAWTALVVVSVWVADSAAYFGGRAFGRRLLAPAISPKKTWEGAVSGEIGGIGAASLLAAVFGLPVLPAAAVGALAGTVGLAGDLAESALKRAAGVKDSGGLLPGHGGILDRFDALLFVAPAAYFLIREWAR